MNDAVVSNMIRLRFNCLSKVI